MTATISTRRIKQIVKNTIAERIAAKEYIELDKRQLKELKNLLTEINNDLNQIIDNGINKIEQKLEDSEVVELAMGIMAITNALASSRKLLADAANAAITIRNNYEL